MPRNRKHSAMAEGGGIDEWIAYEKGLSPEERMWNAALEKRMKMKKRLLLLTAALPAGIMSIVFILHGPLVLCLVPFTAHVILFLLVYTGNIDPCIEWEYFTYSRIRFLACQLGRKELNAPIGLRDIMEGRFLIKLIWQNDSVMMVRKLFILRSFLYIPLLAMDIAAGSYYTIIVAIIMIGFLSPVLIPIAFGTQQGSSGDNYIPSSDSPLDYLFMSMSPSGRAIILDRAIWGREVCATHPLKIRVALQEELEKCEKEEKKRPTRPQMDLEDRTPPPYEVR